MQDKSISVVGIGKLGLCTAACFARKGFRVIGADVNRETVDAVNQRRSPVYEPGLAELLVQVGDRLRATLDIREAVAETRATFIVVPTPSDVGGGFSTRYAEDACQRIGQALRDTRRHHDVMLVSTVLPGASDGTLIPLLEQTSGRTCGKDFSYCYNPEFIALGSVIRDFTNPDVVLIGERDPASGARLANLYKVVCDNDPPVARMSVRNAELAKISLNAYVTMKISFANTLAEICERIPGGDVDAVTGMLGLDKRIGRKYLSGGLAYGGPCFPRDNAAFAAFAASVGSEARLSRATDAENAHQVSRVASLVLQKLGALTGKRIAVLGLTYKPETDVVDESAAVAIVQALARDGATLVVYDPAGLENARAVLSDDSIVYARSLRECLSGADLAVIATPWPEFQRLRPEDFSGEMRNAVVLDCWRVFNAADFGQTVEYIALGVNRTPVQAVESEGC